MGGSISQAQYEKLQKLNAEGRRCRMNSCMVRAQYVCKIASWDVKEDSSIQTGYEGKNAKEMAFCTKHSNETVRCYEFHGKREEDGALVTRVACKKFNGESAGYQEQRFYGARKLEKNEKLA